jgi:SAM-dependent methyltransferase
MSTSTLVCPVCRTESTNDHAEVHTDTDYDLVRCVECGVLFTDARSAPPASELYPTFDQSAAPGAATASRKAVSGFLKRRIAIARQAAPAGRSLDFGAGNGAFARAMAASGFDAVGLEPFSLGATETSPGLQLVRAPLAEAAAALGSFDVITLWHVLEHLDDPVPVLQQLATMLRPGGAIVVCVPNERSWQRRAFRRSWFHLDPPRHLIHFDDATLAHTLQRAGLRIDASIPFVPEYGTSGWVQSTVNRVLPHRNFLYEVVKDRGGLKAMSRPAFVGHLVVSLALGAPVLVASWPLEWLAARRKAAATVTLIARPS